METGGQHNRLKGHCPDRTRCALLPFACSQLCWRLEADLIEATRVSQARNTARAGRNT